MSAEIQGRVSIVIVYRITPPEPNVEGFSTNASFQRSFSVAGRLRSLLLSGRSKSLSHRYSCGGKQRSNPGPGR
jgi:hypothetical protein